MEIIIDTNILFSDWALRTEDSRAFLDFVERTGSVIYIPEIVWEETRKNYLDEITSKHAAYVKASKQFGRIFVVQPELKRVEIDFEKEADSYLEWLQRELKFNGSNILPYGEFTKRIAARVMAKRKPFNMENDHEYKDTLVWETVLDVVGTKVGRGDNEVVLISNDSDAFAAVKQNKQVRNQKAEKQEGILHHQLEEDVSTALESGKASNFYYYHSFSAFLAAHYTPIKGIDEHSVKSYLEDSESGFKYQVLHNLRLKTDDIIQAIQLVNPGCLVELNVDRVDIEAVSEIKEFYVRPFQNAEIITASGTVYIHVKAPITYTYANSRNKVPFTLKPVFEVKFNLPYLDGKPAEINLDTITVSNGAELRIPVGFESVTSRIEGIISNIQSLPVSAEMSLLKKIIDSMYISSEPIELFDIDDDAWKNRDLSVIHSTGPPSNYIPITGKRWPFIQSGTTYKKSKKRKEKKRK